MIVKLSKLLNNSLTLSNIEKRIKENDQWKEKISAKTDNVGREKRQLIKSVEEQCD